MASQSKDTDRSKAAQAGNGSSIYHIMKQIDRKLYDLPASNSMRNQEISELQWKYQINFSKVSYYFEIWAEKRRRTIKKLLKEAQTIENTRQKCYKAVLTFSSMSVIASVACLLLNSINKSWSSKSYVAAVSLGSFSFACSLIDVFVRKAKLEEVQVLYQEDESTLEDLETEIRFGALYNVIYDFFPNGVNYKIVKNIIEPQLMNRKELNDLKMLFNELDSACDEKKIFYAIVLSNILIDPDLLQDTYFLSKVQAFSRSTLAEKWWNRLQYKNSYHRSEKVKPLAEIKSFSKQENLFSEFKMFILPVPYDMFTNAASQTVVNCIVIFDAYDVLKIQQEPKESSTFRHLERILLNEYDELSKMYDLLNPYND